MMNLVKRFSLNLPAASAYALLVDIDRVAPCLPGATLEPATEEWTAARSRWWSSWVRMTFRYRGELEIVERDDLALKAVIRGSAREIKGQGTANADLAMSVRDDDRGGSDVEVDAKVDLSGRAAQMGGGMVEAVADRLIGDMVQCLGKSILEDRSEAPAARAAMRPQHPRPTLWEAELPILPSPDPCVLARYSCGHSATVLRGASVGSNNPSAPRLRGRCVPRAGDTPSEGRGDDRTYDETGPTI